MRSLFSTIALVLSLMMLGTGLAPPPASAPANQGPRPIFFVHVSTIQAPPRKLEELPPAGADKGPNGLIAALWADGTCLFARDFHSPGKEFHTRKLSQKQVEEFIAQLEKDGVFKATKNPGVGASVPITFTTIRALSSKQAVSTLLWDERADPTIAGWQSPDAAHREFVAAWTQAKLTTNMLYSIDNAQPLQVGDGPDEQFRGFYINEPHRTIWLQSARWP